MKKRILIVGEGSYIAQSFYAYAKKQFEINLVNSHNNVWKKEKFFGYDTILHCAGIAHIKEKPTLESLYFSINRDLAIEVAKKAKIESVHQFIFLSSMSVYGLLTGKISSKTIPRPVTYYGRSKLEAENGIFSLENNDFRVCILRPPMIYGKNCHGNFQRLRSFAIKTMIFPSIENQRSMLYIDNLCHFLSFAIEHNFSGIFFPQDKEYVSTSEMVRQIALLQGRHVLFTGIANPLIRFLVKRNRTAAKIFGNLIYEKDMSRIQGFDYALTTFDKAVYQSI